MIRQLAFDLPAQETWRRADFFVSPANELALAAVESVRDWPLGKMVIVGPEGAGKTHLAHLWCEATGGLLLRAEDLMALDLRRPDLPGAIAVDDADRVAGQGAAEEALFHLHNLILPAGRLLLTAGAPPRDWGLRLPDLQSRVEAAGIIRMEAPDDALLAAVLVKLFADRQVSVSPALIGWLVQRMERSLGHARELVAALDAMALAQGKPISRSMAEALLDSDRAE